MKTVILAAGAGNRVKPLSINKPKVMLKLMGKPLLQYVVENAAAAGLKDIIIVTGENGEQIRSYFGDGSRFDVRIQYTYQEKPVSTANAIETAEHLLDDSFFVLNGDDIFEPELLKAMMDKFQEYNTDEYILLSCKPVRETWKFGIVALDGERVTKIVEKPKPGEEPSNLAIIGAYIMTKDIFDYIRKVPVRNQQLEDAMQAFIDDGGIVQALSYDGFFCSFKYPWDLFKINKYLMDNLSTKISATATISDKAVVDGHVFIGERVKVMEGAIIKGPCYIGNDTVIGTNVIVREYSNIGSNCIIGFSSEVTRSIIGDGCWLHTNYIGDSIVSDNCKFGAGTVTANLLFNEENVKVNVHGEAVDTGSNKFGVIIAENCKTGVNCSLMPGVKIGPDSIVGPGVCLREDLPPGKIILIDKNSYVVKENKI